MFDNLFTPSPAVWSVLIGGAIALPFLIHLINLLRHQRVDWAAMEFLLKSHKKNRNWVWLKQLLLLLSRMAVLLLALFLLAQVGCHDNRIAKLLGGATTHHYLLLDDSFSMSERNSEGAAFDRARSTLSLIAARAGHRQNQFVTLLRYSSSRSGRADGISNDDDSNGQISTNTEGQPSVGDLDGVLKSGLSGQLAADLNGVLVDNLFEQQIENLKSRLQVSSLAVGVEGVLNSVQQLIADRKNENAIVYVLSDFRKRDWDNPESVGRTLEQIHQHGAGIELIRCAPVQQKNLAITALEPAGNVRVAGTPLMMQVAVKNCSPTSATKVQVKLNVIAFSDTRASVEATRKASAEATKTATENFQSGSQRGEELPTLFIPEIPPGETVTQRFPVFFETTGQHVIYADLPDDAIQTDNRRWCTTEFRSAAKVLVIDDSQQRHSGFLSLALNPNRMTGLRTEIKTKDFLRDTNSEQLREFDVMLLLDVDRLDDSAVRNVEEFAQTGGGVAFFVGPKTNLNFFNSSLYREGAGILPMPLGAIANVPEMIEEKIPDIWPNPHPIFAPVLGVKNSLLSLVQVKKIMTPPATWLAKTATVGMSPSSDETLIDTSIETSIETAEVLATVRGNSSWPLVIEKRFGKGRVVLFTTTAGPVWNNWSRNATFPPVLLLLQDYLAAGKYDDEVRLVGTPISVEVSVNDYLSKATIEMQANAEMLVGQSIELKLERSSDGQQLAGTFGKFNPATHNSDLDDPGIYDIVLVRQDSSKEIRRYAVNVDTSESENEVANEQELLTSLETAHPTLVQWNEFNPEPKQKPASSLGKLLLLLLTVLLLAEQALAYSASFHESK